MAKRLLQGNEAVALAARSAGLGFFAGYPITPASEILHYLLNTEVKVFQMEDEIASIHACLGASLAGAKAMTATSGPGFSLMQEGIGLAHMIEVPLVIVDVQRVGPSTGMPTMPAQGDVLQSLNGSHGDYFPIVFCPNSVSELYRYTIEAFNAAEELSGPVVLLSDGYISHLYETVETPKIEPKSRRREPLGSGRRHFTGLTHKDDVPITTDAQVHKELILRFKRKQSRVAEIYNHYEYLKDKSSKALIISYGALSRVAYKFMGECSLFRPIRIFPVVEEMKEVASRYEKIVVMEMNAGQYKREVERVLGREVEFIPVLGGRIDIKEIGERIRWVLRDS